MLRDLINFAWRASAKGQVNYPIASVLDIETGKVDAYNVLRGPD